MPKFFDTPLEKMSNVSCHVVQREEDPAKGWTGCIAFECDTIPVLKDRASYKPAGDVVIQIDSNLAKFGQRAWPLLRTSEVECIHKLFDVNGDPPTYNTLTYNRNSKTYFFHHNDRESFFE